ncbi:MAG: J domain-containing protein [Flavobacteriales bacterium]|nr:J domain-containing protein [Flavobacteriales bacterium]
MNINHCFNILGLAPGSDLITVKKKFKELSKKYHPDVNPSPDAHFYFTQINQAYQLITKYYQTQNNKTIYRFQQEKEKQERTYQYRKRRFEEYLKQREAFEKTSVHEIYWGKPITIVLTILALFFAFDTYLPLDSITEPVLSYKKYCNHGEHCSGTIQTANFILGTDKTFSYIWQGEPIQIYYSVLLKDVRYYSLANNPSISFHPPYHTAQYGILAVIIFICGILVLFFPLKSFSSRLIVKTIMLFSVFIYSIIQLLFRLN